MTKRILKYLNQGGKTTAASEKGSWLSQDIFQDEIEERITKRKIIIREHYISFQSDTDNDNGIYSTSSHLQHVI